MTTAPSANAGRVLAIVNGRIRARTRATITAELQSRGIDVALSSAAGEAVEIAHGASAYTDIIAVGGDGTIFEVVNGMDLDRHRLSVIPAGTMNCAARQLGLKGLDRSLAAFSGGHRTSVDVMVATITRAHGATAVYRVLSFLAAGFEARVTALGRRLRPLPGSVRYGLATMLSALALPRLRATVAINGATPAPRTFTSLLVNNAFSQSFSNVPSWDLRDGTVEVSMPRRNPASQFLYVFNRFVSFGGRRAWTPAVRSVSCEFGEPVSLMMDGELLQEVRAVRVAVLPQKLSIVVPQSRSLSFGVKM